MRQVFQRARNSSPCVIFFDELDALCPRRSGGKDGGNVGCGGGGTEAGTDGGRRRMRDGRRRRRCSRAVTSNVSAQVKKALVELNLGESVAFSVSGLLNTCDVVITQ